MKRFDRLFLCFLPLLLLSSCAKKEAPLPLPREVTPEETETLRAADAPFSEEIYFLGDSTTAHLTARSEVPAERVFAAKERYMNLDPGTADVKVLYKGEETPLTSALAAERPRYLVLTLGIDHGVYYYRDKPETFRYCYEKLLKAIREATPETVLILQSVFPVGRNSPAITNEMVDRANETIRALAADEGLFFLDTNPLLKDGDGFLAEEYVFSEDGIHLTASAYRVILDRLYSGENEIKEAEK